MSGLAKIATKIRHSALLKNSDHLWNVLRKPYHFLLNIKSNGVEVKINDHFTYRIPPEYYYVGLENYERENVEFLVNWIRENPECYILDLGCSIGLMSVISLFASEKAQVLSFDSDLASLKATLKMCSYAPSGQIRLIWGLVSEHSAPKRQLHEAIAQTDLALSTSHATGAPGTTRYINLDHAEENTPYYCIDDLFEMEKFSSTILLKCDIEGAELLALLGAKKFLLAHKPDILLSVHPSILPIFNGSIEQVRDYLESLEYTIKIIAVDHEEHWYCHILKN